MLVPLTGNIGLTGYFTGFYTSQISILMITHIYGFDFFKRRASEKEDEEQADRERMDRLLRREGTLDEEELELERRAR